MKSEEYYEGYEGAFTNQINPYISIMHIEFKKYNDWFDGYYDSKIDIIKLGVY